MSTENLPEMLPDIIKTNMFIVKTRKKQIVENCYTKLDKPFWSTCSGNMSGNLSSNKNAKL